MNYNIRYLLGGQGKFYKANLHSKSSLSDGRLSPEELKRLYKENGYSVLAITDTEPRDFGNLADEDFLMLSGFDFGARDKEKASALRRLCHRLEKSAPRHLAGVYARG